MRVLDRLGALDNRVLGPRRNTRRQMLEAWGLLFSGAAFAFAWSARFVPAAVASTVALTSAVLARREQRRSAA